MQRLWMLINDKSPWSFYLLSFLLGSISSLALPPIGFIWALPIAFSGILELLQHLPAKKKQFLLGFYFGYGHFIFSLSWIGNALMVEADKFAWMKPIALFGIPAVLACYIGMVMMITGLVRNNRYIMWWIFSLTWVVAELVRSYLFFPFPWNLLGYSFASSETMSQFASIIGVYGLSWLMVISSTVLFTRSIPAVTLICLMLGAVYLWGWDYLKKENFDESLSLRLIQPNPAHHHLGDMNERMKQIHQLLVLSNESSSLRPEAVIWPEGVLPLLADDQALKTLAHLLPKGTWLLSGADRVISNGHNRAYYNSIISSTPDGDLASSYDKHILVPFGEYIPLRWLLPSFVEKVAYGMGDFNRGKEYALIKVGNHYAIPLICYESLFSLFINNFSLAKAGFLLNVTNDDWFGNSLGPYQHLAMAKFRAIEYGKPLVRVANTGISTAVDAHGRELASIPLGQDGMLDVQINPSPKNLTFYYEYILWLKFIFIFSVVSSCVMIALSGESLRTKQ